MNYQPAATFQFSFESLQRRLPGEPLRGRTGESREIHQAWLERTFARLVKSLPDEFLRERWAEALERTEAWEEDPPRQYTLAHERGYALAHALDQEWSRRGGLAPTTDPAGMGNEDLLDELMHLTARLNNDLDMYVDYGSCALRVDVLQAEILRRMAGAGP